MIILCQIKGNCYIGKLFPCWENTFASRSYLYSGVKLLDLQKKDSAIYHSTNREFDYIETDNENFRQAEMFK